MNRKASIILIFILLVNPIISKSQSGIENFFIPSYGYNFTFFDCPNKDGLLTELNKSIMYSLSNKTIKTITRNYRRMEVYSTNESTYIITNDAIKLVKTKNNSILGDGEEITYKVSKTILKYPIANKPQYWEFNLNGDTYKCKSEFETITINGDDKLAIKVTQTIVTASKRIISTKIIEHYVVGIGLWRIDMKTKEGEIIIIDQYNASMTIN